MTHRPMFEKQASSLKQVLLNEYLSPQVARLANWLVRVTCLFASKRTLMVRSLRQTGLLLWRPMTRSCSRLLMMVLVQAGRAADQALQWADRIAARNRRSVGSPTTAAAGRIWFRGVLETQRMLLVKPNLIIPTCSWRLLICALAAQPTHTAR